MCIFLEISRFLYSFKGSENAERQIFKRYDWSKITWLFGQKIFQWNYALPTSENWGFAATPCCRATYKLNSTTNLTNCKVLKRQLQSVTKRRAPDMPHFEAIKKRGKNVGLGLRAYNLLPVNTFHFFSEEQIGTEIALSPHWSPSIILIKIFIFPEGS